MKKYINSFNKWNVIISGIVILAIVTLVLALLPSRIHTSPTTPANMILQTNSSAMMLHGTGTSPTTLAVPHLHVI